MKGTILFLLLLAGVLGGAGAGLWKPLRVHGLETGETPKLTGLETGEGRTGVARGLETGLLQD